MWSAAMGAAADSRNRLTSLQACRDITDQISPNVQRSVFVEGTAPDALYSRRQGNGNEGQCLSIQRSVKAELASFYPSRDRCLAQRVREQCSSPPVRSLWLVSRRIPMLEFCMTLSASSLDRAPLHQQCYLPQFIHACKGVAQDGDSTLAYNLRLTFLTSENLRCCFLPRRVGELPFEDCLLSSALQMECRRQLKCVIYRALVSETTAT